MVTQSFEVDVVHSFVRLDSFHGFTALWVSSSVTINIGLFRDDNCANSGTLDGKTQDRRGFV